MNPPHSPGLSMHTCHSMSSALGAPQLRLYTWPVAPHQCSEARRKGGVGKIWELPTLAGRRANTSTSTQDYRILLSWPKNETGPLICGNLYVHGQPNQDLKDQVNDKIQSACHLLTRCQYVCIYVCMHVCMDACMHA